MIIKREIDGKTLEIKLTNAEIIEAYTEREHSLDVSFCKSKLEDYDEESFMEEYGVTKEEGRAELDVIAYEMRRQINKYDLDEDYARECAFSEILPGKEYF